jgi:hypothetical protein
MARRPSGAVVRAAHAVYQVRASRGYGETELDRAAGLLAGRGEAVMTEEAIAAFVKRYEEVKQRK